MIKKTRNRTKTYFFAIIAFLAIEVIILTVSFFFYRKQALDLEEEKYHEKDLISAGYLIEDQNNNIPLVIHLENNETELLYIDAEGNIIAKAGSSKVSIPGDNLFTILGKSKIYGISLEEAKQNIISGNSGRFEIYFSKRGKVLIYTPAQDGEHFMVRVVPTQYFDDSRYVFALIGNHQLIVSCIIILCIFILLMRIYKYVLIMEAADARRNLIAADNDLVSFVFHSSIASFELSGSVERVFGEEIAKRGRVDWKTLSEMLHPDDQKLFRNISVAIRDGDKKYTTEFRMCNDNTKENYHWYRLNGKTVVKDDGENRIFVGTIQNSDDQIIHENMLKNKAEHDLLTGLLNKITSEETINMTISSNKHNVFAFYIIDLDNFKAVNDNLGHAVGDKVLEDVSSKLKLVFNEADVIGRLGGDEFAVLLVIPPIMVSQADKLIREKAAHLNDILKTEYGNDEIKINVSASIGIAKCPDAGEDFQALYKCADKALYHSKENGKDQYTIYGE